eukprot:TRINITY_DN6984_c0_g3_i1.p1 TRINITY_DN6984_c0_g3~~TRINITY_DN6984_c0_g3_i1.p1  ORF type:complete len:310 (+),score=114.71 TRINITY_DN6984_c0_g3_i1:87-1016(+)
MTYNHNKAAGKGARKTERKGRTHVADLPRTSVKVTGVLPVMSRSAVDTCFKNHGMEVAPNGFHVAGEDGINAVGMPVRAGVCVTSQALMASLCRDLESGSKAAAARKGVSYTPGKVKARPYYFKVDKQEQDKRNKSCVVVVLCAPLIPGAAPFPHNQTDALCQSLGPVAQDHGVKISNVFQTRSKKPHPNRSTAQYAQSVTTFALVLETSEDAERMVGVFDAFIDRPNLGDYSFYGLQRQRKPKEYMNKRTGSSDTNSVDSDPLNMSSAESSCTSSVACLWELDTENTAPESEAEDEEHVRYLCSAFAG